MNDVKITEHDTGAITYDDGEVKYSGLTFAVIPAPVVAALREHFAVEQPVTPTPTTEQIERLRSALVTAQRHSRFTARQGGCPHPDYTRLEDAVAAFLASAEQPTPCTDPTCGAVLYGGAPAQHWHEQSALVSPVSEQPAPLDPEPWEDAATIPKHRHWWSVPENIDGVPWQKCAGCKAQRIARTDVEDER